MSDKLAGNQVGLTFGGTEVKVTKVTPKVTKEMADSTDSGNYDATSKLIHREQLAHSISTELSVEGKFRTANPATTSALLAKCYKGDAAAAGAVKVDPSTTLFSGNWDITDFEADIPIDNVVTFKCTLKSHGVIVVGA